MGTEWAYLVFSDSLVRDNEKLSAFVEVEAAILTASCFDLSKCVKRRPAQETHTKTQERNSRLKGVS